MIGKLVAACALLALPLASLAQGYPAKSETEKWGKVVRATGARAE